VGHTGLELGELILLNAGALDISHRSSYYPLPELAKTGLSDVALPPEPELGRIL
jgi:hypothetical protein